MGALDANGIYRYDGSEIVQNTGFDEILELGQDATSAALAALVAATAEAHGNVSVQTDINGFITINHALGKVPTSVQLTVWRPGCANDTIAQLAAPIAWSATSTQIVVKVMRRDTNVAFAQNSVGIGWSAR